MKALEDHLAGSPVSIRRDTLWKLVRAMEQLGNSEGLIDVGELFLGLEPPPVPEDAAQVRVRMGRVLFRLGDPRAFDLARDAYAHYKESGDHSRRARETLDLLVDTYLLTNELDECIQLLGTELEHARSDGDIAWYAQLLDKLALVMHARGRKDVALAERKAALGMLRMLKKDGEFRDTLMSWTVRDADASSGDMARMAKRLVLIPELMKLEHDLLVALGVGLHELGRLDTALQCMDEALEVALRSADPRVFPAHIERAGVLLSMGRHGEALASARQGRTFARQWGDMRALLNASRTLYTIHRAMGNTGAALSMLEHVQNYEDSLDQEDLRIALAKQQVEYLRKQETSLYKVELARQEAERELAELEARNRGRIALGTAAGGIMLVAGLAAWFVTDRKRRRERFEKEAATLETQALRSQMNPHFIFNALNSINAFVQQNDPDNASSFLTKFSRVMRSVLENSRHSEVPLQDDLDTLRGYLDLESRRMHGKFDFTIEVDPDIDPEEVMVPPLVVQPFVENAIWHGVASKEGRGHITLRIHSEGGQLMWVVEDDGVGRHAKKQPDANAPSGGAGKKTSLGTAITRSRLDLVEKQHGGKAGFHYEDLPQGTRVVVQMPLLNS